MLKLRKMDIGIFSALVVATRMQAVVHVFSAALASAGCSGPSAPIRVPLEPTPFLALVSEPFASDPLPMLLG
jgi:hypothetical protein